jgi:hypothetical protein
LAAIGFASQVLLAEGRAVVRPVYFLPDERDRPLRVDFADRGRRGAARNSAANQKILNVKVAHCRALAHQPERLLL